MNNKCMQSDDLKSKYIPHYIHAINQSTTSKTSLPLLLIYNFVIYITRLTYEIIYILEGQSSSYLKVLCLFLSGVCSTHNLHTSSSSFKDSGSLELGSWKGQFTSSLIQRFVLFFKRYCPLGSKQIQVVSRPSHNQVALFSHIVLLA